ncbi:MAG TPA: DUF4097 family beta strand repeat-containing protein [Acidimicrobiales bacterium]|nr:DUF4097 family beta strand repeat-containing protein [Acidimicrobiales bacterium]
MQTNEEETMNHRFDTPGAVRLRVDNASGEIRLLSHDEPVTEVEVTGLSAEAEELVERTRAEHRPHGERHEVVVEVPRRRGLLSMQSAPVAVVVRLPSGSDVVLAGASAEIELSGQFGSGEVRSGSGEIRADRFAGPLYLKTASGSVRIEEVGGALDAAAASGDLEVGRLGDRASVRIASGDVRIRRAEAPVEAHAASGDVIVDLALEGLSAVTASGDVRAACVRAGRVEARTASGDVTVGVARGARVRVDATSMSGSMESEIPLGESVDPTGADAGGDQGPLVEVHVRTASGDVRLVRAATEAVEP